MMKQITIDDILEDTKRIYEGDYDDENIKQKNKILVSKKN